MAQASSEEASVIKAYWQPGCTSCLRMKEFLTKHDVAFVSVNVLEDQDAFEELATLGIRSVPIVRRGKDWANGQVLRDVARVAGIAWGGAQVLPASELVARLIAIQTTAQRLFAQIPDDKLAPACCRIGRAATPSSAITSSTSPMPSSSTRSRACRSRKASTPVCRRRRWTPRPNYWPTDATCWSASGSGGMAQAERPIFRARPGSITATLRCTNISSG